MPSIDSRSFYTAVKAQRFHYDADQLVVLLERVDQQRVALLSDSLAEYISLKLLDTVEKRNGLADYRSNPYVTLTSARIMAALLAPDVLAHFLFNTKLYAGLETSFGKSIEAEFVGVYPVDAAPGSKWAEPEEKIKETATIDAMRLPGPEKARLRSSAPVTGTCTIGIIQVCFMHE